MGPLTPLRRTANRVGLVVGIAIAAAAGLGALLSSHGSVSVLDSAKTARFVSDGVFQHTGYRVVDVRCPSGIHATVGVGFTCHFTGPEGPYTAYLRIENLQGRRVVFRWKTQPSSWPAPTLR
jgi:Domain of unknown function (DUF4333)